MNESLEENEFLILAILSLKFHHQPVRTHCPVFGLAMFWHLINPSAAALPVIYVDAVLVSIFVVVQSKSHFELD